MFLTRLIFPVAVAMAGIFYFAAYGRMLVLNTMTTRAEAQIQQFSSMVHDINDYLEVKRKLEERESLLSRAIGRQPLWLGVLKELSRITPQEISLHRLEVKPGEAKKQLVITGEVVSEYTNLDLALSQYTLSMSESPFFSDVKMVSSERDVYSPIPKAIFQIVCELKV